MIRRRVPAPSVWLLAAWLVVLAGETGVHLVHHLLDDDGGADCGFLGTVHHAPAHVDAAPALPLPALSAEPLPRPGRVSASPGIPLLRTARGPPEALPASTA